MPRPKTKRPPLAAVPKSEPTKSEPEAPPPGEPQLKEAAITMTFGQKETLVIRHALLQTWPHYANSPENDIVETAANLLRVFNQAKSLFEQPAPVPPAQPTETP